MEIVTVRLHHLGDRIMAEIGEEIDRIRALWPVNTLVAA